jgi:hypothetical protein
MSANPHHPCAALPVTGLNFSVWYCHHHQAYAVTKMIYTERAEGDIELEVMRGVEFGPFDTWEAVCDWLNDEIPIDGLAPRTLG